MFRAPDDWDQPANTLDPQRERHAIMRITPMRKDIRLTIPRYLNSFEGMKSHTRDSIKNTTDDMANPAHDFLASSASMDKAGNE